MPDLRSLTQEPLGTRANWNPNTTYLIVIDVNKDITKKIVFSKTLDFKKDTQSFIGFGESLSRITGSNPTELLDLIMEEDCFIELYLSDNLDWYWRDTNAITTSRPLGAFYFNLQYAIPTGWAAAPQGKCKAVRFGAELRADGPGPRDSFNLNLILEYPGAEILPITIDPDIQNPGVRP